MESLIAVTAATGQLGRLVVTSLLERGIPADRIVATARDTGRASDLTTLGVQVREADYSRPETLDIALEGVERLLLISGNDLGNRVAQHENVVRAAERAGVGLLAYTSIANIDKSTLPLAQEHKQTEDVIRSSHMSYAMLRNNWYFENYTATIRQAAEHGTILGSAGEGRLSAASRQDYAAAAAAVLAGEGYRNSIHELGGDTAFTMSELAAEVARRSGREVVYRDLPADAYAESLIGFGVPEPVAHMIADIDLGIGRGELFTDSGDLHRLIGRPTMTLADAVAAALQGHPKTAEG